MGGPDSFAIGVLPSTRDSLSYAMNYLLRLRRPDRQAIGATRCNPIDPRESALTLTLSQRERGL